LGASVWHDDDHRLGLFIGGEVVHEGIHARESLPFGLVAPDAV
jgi:hypothetical protein